MLSHKALTYGPICIIGCLVVAASAQVPSAVSTMPAAIASGVQAQDRGSTAVADNTSYMNLIIAHGAVGAAAWTVLSPGMVLLATFGRSWKDWMKMHRAVQVIGTIVLTIVAIGLASVAVNQLDTEHMKGGHQIIGALLLVLVVIQAFGGSYIHRRYNPERTKKPGRNVGHIALGICITLLGFAQIASGLEEYKDKTGRKVHTAIWAIYGVLFAGSVGAWLLSAIRNMYLRVSRGAPLRSEKRLLYSTDSSELGTLNK